MNNTVKIIIIVAALGAAALLIVRSMGGAEDSGDGRHVAYYICADPACATEFEVEPGKSIAPPESSTEICPECRKDWPHRGAKCEACGRIAAMTGHGISPSECPHCGGGPMKSNDS